MPSSPSTPVFPERMGRAYHSTMIGHRADMGWVDGKRGTAVWRTMGRGGVDLEAAAARAGEIGNFQSTSWQRREAANEVGAAPRFLLLELGPFISFRVRGRRAASEGTHDYRSCAKSGFSVERG